MRIGPIEISWVPRGKWNEVWIKGDGTRMTVGEMSNAHVRNSLSMVVRVANKDNMWYAGKNGGVRYSPRAVLFTGFVAEYLNKLKEEGTIISFKFKESPDEIDVP